MYDFNHLIEIDKYNKSITVFRIESDGKKWLYTSINLPSINESVEKELLQEFAMQLGEILLIDSPVIRELYGL